MSGQTNQDVGVEAALSRSASHAAYGTTDLEDVLKILASVLPTNSGKELFKYFNNLKDEQKRLSTYFTSVFKLVSAYDDMDKSKQRVAVVKPCGYIHAVSSAGNAKINSNISMH